jgi:hypothetical protein
MHHDHRWPVRFVDRFKDIVINPIWVRIRRMPHLLINGWLCLSTACSQFAAIQAVAPPIKVELSPIDVRNGSEIERAITAFAREPNGGLIATASVAAAAHSKLIVLLAARHRLPSVYAFRTWVTEGGLISYGPDLDDQYRRAAHYVDRIPRARNRPSYRCRRRQSTSWSSTSRRQMRSA